MMTGTALARSAIGHRAKLAARVLDIAGATDRAEEHVANQLGDPADRTVPVALSFVGFLIVTAGAFVGGDVVYVFGNMVSRHAFRGAGTKWIKLDTGDVSDLAALPDATPTKMRAGINDLVVVRQGDTVQALHAVCAHAGGPLDQGAIVDGCVECPWHGSRFRLSDGLVRQGPSVYDQPSYEIRTADGGGYEVRRRIVT